MWVSPRGIGLQQFITEVFWNCEDWFPSKDNELFQLLKYKPTGFLGGLISTTMKLSTSSPPLTYRIVLKNPHDKNVYVLAVSDNEETIKKHWDYLIRNLIPHIQATRASSPTNTPKSNSNSSTPDLELDKELIQFVLSKVESLSQV